MEKYYERPSAIISAECMRVEGHLALGTPHSWRVTRSGVTKGPESKHQLAKRAYRWRESILERDQHRCQACGDTKGLFEVDHLIELQLGNINEMWNLWTLCRSCHSVKSGFDMLGGGDRKYRYPPHSRS